MVASWVRRNFDGVGVTQYKPGRHLEAVQAHFGGRALLCIDVSGSMSGGPLRAAVEGGQDFLTEAREAHYATGLVLWDHGVKAHLPTTAKEGAVRAALRGATSGGGTDLCPALRVAISELGPMSGDRVVCVFSDGGIGNVAEAEKLAAKARALGIRFVVRGLGERSSRGLARVLRPDGEEDAREQTVRDVGDLRRGIASMARSLRTRRGKG
jgi:Mg-chelatase subunit ChlD